LHYSNHVLTTDPGDHVWAVVKETCDLSHEADKFLLHAVSTIRDAYGEQELREMAENAPLITLPDPADGVAGTFVLDHLLSAFRASLPDPAAEGAKPAHLTNYRSETTELIARAALAAVYQFATPPALHATKGNRNQPILGFDGWSVMQMSDAAFALALIQVKGSEDKNRPPNIAAELVMECGQAVIAHEKLSGFLFACLLRCKGTEFEGALLKMIIELEETGRICNTILSPVIVRGVLEAHLDDLASLRGATSSFLHAKARGMTLSIGAGLTDFGRAAMNRARQND
jgi:hypothetical protein